MGRLIDEYEAIKTQQECVSKTIDTLWKMAQKYQQLQADYENRLKADLKAILVELQLEIEECVDGAEGSPQFEHGVTTARVQVVEIIQQKINELEGEVRGKE